MKVSELMTAEPKTVKADTPIEEAGAWMVRQGFRHLPVVGANGSLVGMVTDAAVFRHGTFLDGDRKWMAFETGFDTLRCGDVAAEIDVVVGPDEPLAAALERLSDSSQDAVVVVDAHRRPVGILSEHDVVRFAAERLDPELAPEVQGIGSEEVLTVDIDDPATRALDVMVENAVRHVVATSDGAVVGVISLRDVLIEDIHRRTQLAIRDVLRDQQVQTAPIGTPTAELAALMRRYKIGCVPLVDADQRPAAIVTRRDMLEVVLDILGAGA